MRFKPGKLHPDLLERLLSGAPVKDERVLIGPGVGRDVCVMRAGPKLLVAKTDPITFATENIGWYVVHVNANDIATVGARPRWFLLTALLPEGNTDEALVNSIWDQVQEALASIGCELCGGHTEVTVGLDRPILVGQMLGEVGAEELVDKRNARPGDRVLLTKGVPVEGTAVMALERGDELAEAFSPEKIQRAALYLREPGISVLKEAMAACAAGEVHAMHDPTEGGVATGLWELARATELGLLVHAERINVLEPGRSFCAFFGLDPLGVLSSGTLLLCVAPQSAQAVCEAIAREGVSCVDIGRLAPPEDGIVLVREGREAPMPTFHRDEITRLFE